MERRDTTRAGSLAWVLIVIGALALFFSRDIPTSSIGGNRDPGPRLFPMLLALILLFGGVVQVGVWCWLRRTSDDQRARSREQPTLAMVLRDERNRDLWFFLLTILIYLPALSVLGFALSSWLFATSLMVWLGVKWWHAGLIALLMISVVHLLFGQLFKVQLPAGWLGLPF